MSDTPPITRTGVLTRVKYANGRIAWEMQAGAVILFEDDRSHRKLIARYWRCEWLNKIKGDDKKHQRNATLWAEWERNK